MTEIDSLGPTQSGVGNIRNLDHTILLCDDIAAMRHFYGDVLGFAIHEEIPDRWVSLRVGSSLLALRRRSRPYDGPSPLAAAVHLAFRVPPGDVGVAASQLQARGAEILEPVHDQPFGHRTVFVADPEHNVVEIFAEI